jgi:hypothetical protein
MARPLYSAEIFGAHDFTDASFVIADGLVAVIRTIVMYVGGIDIGASLTLSYEDTGQVLFYSSGSILEGGVSLVVPDIRIVVEAGRNVACSIFALGSPNGDLSLFGYLLTVP